ncbi:hypothetical protein MHBO_003510 [Bonamia ostreae]|uniref:Uncharacterized protein n=1 Tax=Bonamia ostreae TaxID=126728 RepID=A0ABV2AR98_9EUKA
MKYLESAKETIDAMEDSDNKSKLLDLYDQIEESMKNRDFINPIANSVKFLLLSLALF